MMSSIRQIIFSSVHGHSIGCEATDGHLAIVKMIHDSGLASGWVGITSATGERHLINLAHVVRITDTAPPG